MLFACYGNADPKAKVKGRLFVVVLVVDKLTNGALLDCQRGAFQGFLDERPQFYWTPPEMRMNIVLLIYSHKESTTNDTLWT